MSQRKKENHGSAIIRLAGTIIRSLMETKGKKAWLFHRGHLIGYQFSGLTDEGKNLVPLTAWTNTGNYKGTADSNVEGMLYYEKRLDSWLATHPNYWLDYKGTPGYTGDELILGK